jgi:hypothetical protein
VRGIRQNSCPSKVMEVTAAAAEEAELVADLWAARRES